MTNEPTPTESRGNAWLRIGAALLVTGLVVVVVRALPSGETSAASDDASASAPSIEAGRASPQGLERPPEASCEMAILVDKTDDELKPLLDVAAAANLLGPEHCGDGCDAVKKYVREKDHVDIDTQSAPDYMLPPAESLDVVGATLTDAQRKRVHQLPNVLIVRTHARATIDQLAARSCFALTQALAEKTSGLIYDETVRHIEDIPHFAERAIRGPLGKPVFLPRHISVQLYRQPDGTARLLTLGMQRFGSPDFVVAGGAMDSGSALGHLLNAVCASAAAMKDAVPITITLDDVVKTSGAKRDAVAPDAGKSEPVTLDVVEADRVEGDPENDVVALVPAGGADPAGWDAALAKLYGRPVRIVNRDRDARLDGVAARAKKTLPDAIARFEKKEGKLFVKGPFPIPNPRDGGAREEWMWIEATQCDARGCGGTLTNEPGYATNLAIGKAVRVERDATLDWLIELPDGGKVGGQSIDILEGRQ